jgi:hypothetical protein
LNDAERRFSPLADPAAQRFGQRRFALVTKTPIQLF